MRPYRAGTVRGAWNCPSPPGTAPLLTNFTTELDMLRDKDAVTNLAVKDIDAARKFYEDTLGLEKIATEGEELLVFKSGGSKIFVYRSEFAGTNKATAMTWVVGGDVDGIVKDLKARGIGFEHYDMPGLTLEGDVHVGDDMKVAWFKDPDGNVLSVVSG
jgi:catechol 2,3-dioxygenase-like lactoylglutathione lyase family enzyme